MGYGGIYFIGEREGGYILYVVEAVRVKKALTSYRAAASTIFGMGVL